jgi:hypothetical protein
MEKPSPVYGLDTGGHGELAKSVELMETFVDI